MVERKGGADFYDVMGPGILSSVVNQAEVEGTSSGHTISIYIRSIISFLLVFLGSRRRALRNAEPRSQTTAANVNAPRVTCSPSDTDASARRTSDRSTFFILFLLRSFSVCLVSAFSGARAQHTFVRNTNEKRTDEDRKKRVEIDSLSESERTSHARRKRRRAEKRREKFEYDSHKSITN